MDTTLLIEIVIAIIVAYFLIKFIVSPLIKLVVGILAVLTIIYLLQRFFGFDIDKITEPFGISLNSSEWGQNFSWIINPINYVINQIESFIKFVFGNISETINN
ncbi:MAG: hypothetical protein WC711_02265 [Candidatus Staskawiczbacteria bacterium]|jgi:hypothetical protein